LETFSGIHDPPFKKLETVSRIPEYMILLEILLEIENCSLGIHDPPFLENENCFRNTRYMTLPF
jgi:hypothetical protein